MNTKHFVRKQTRKNVSNTESRNAVSKIYDNSTVTDIKKTKQRNRSRIIYDKSRDRDISITELKNNPRAVSRNSCARNTNNNDARIVISTISGRYNKNDFENIELINDSRTNALTSNGNDIEITVPENDVRNEFVGVLMTKRIEVAKPKKASKTNCLTPRKIAFKNKCSRRVSRKIVPVDIQSETYFVKSELEITNMFLPILKLGMILGLCVSHDLASKKSFLVKLLSKLWMVLVTSIFTISTALTGYNIKFLLPSDANRISYYAHCLCGLSVMWVFLLRNHNIKESLERMFHVTSNFYSKLNEKKQLIFLSLVLTGAQAALMALIVTKFYFYDEWDSMNINLKECVPFPEGSLLRKYYNWFSLFSITYSYSMSTCILYFTMLLCGVVYRSSGTLISLYEDELTDIFDKRSFKASTANGTTDKFKRVSSCIQDIDKTFGIFSFIIHAAIFFIVYGGLSIFLTGDSRLQSYSIIIFGFLCWTMGFEMLLYVAYSGEEVMVKHEFLKKKLMGLSDSLFKQSPDVSTLVMFDLLSKDIREKKLRVTLIGLFDIRKRFVLSVFGVLVSYISLLYQLGTMRNS